MIDDRARSRYRAAAPLLVILALAAPAGLAGQTADSVAGAEEEPTPQPSSGVPLELQVRGTAGYFGNFFQAPEGEEHESVRAMTGEARVIRPFASGSYAFAAASGTFYSQFDPGSNLLGGFGWSAWPHLLEAYAGYRSHTPRLDVGDTLGFANLVYVHASYSVRPARIIQLEALVDYYDEAHGQRPERDNTFLDVGGALRYRGLGRIFSPELGVAFGARDVAEDTEDLGQRTVWITVRSTPTPTLSLRLRYRDRARDYSVDDNTALNFGREDQRHELALASTLRLRDDLSWTVYYSFQHATSTRANRNFDAQYIQTGVEYRLTGGRR
jgi:hypothetical protein